MKPCSSALSAHFSSEVTTLATCWKLTRRDGTILGFTDHDSDIFFESVLYQADSGFTPSAVASRGDFSVDNLEVEGMLASGSLTEADIMAGLYDYAEVAVFLVNYTDISQGALMLRRGWIGEISLKSGQFVAEMRGLAQAFAQNIGELYSPSCRAALGDARCKVNLAPFTVTGNVTALGADARLQFTDSARSEDAGLFSGGKITFSSGANNGLSMEVKTHSQLTGGAGGSISLMLPLPYALQAGDDYTLIAGCDKTIGTCKARFDNVVNFRGEPHLPGMDKMLGTPSV